MPPQGWETRDGQFDLARPSPVLMLGLLLLDLDRNYASVDGHSLHLSASEFAALATLIAARDTPVSREAIAAALSRSGAAPNPRLPDILVCSLRRKLAEAGLDGLIQTAWGRGYIVTSPSHDSHDPVAPRSCFDLIDA